MIKIERIIYDLVKKNPRLKNFVRNIYQYTFSFFNKNRVITNYKINSREGFFFGFHDKIPFSFDERYLLTHKIIPNSKDEIEIGVFKGNKLLEYHPISITNTWNWQQGAMLQWIGKANNLLFHSYENEYVSKVFNVNGQLKDVIPFLIADVSKNGKYGVAFNFERLFFGMPGYGYNKNIYQEKKNIPTNEGLYIYDFEQEKINKLFSIQELNSIKV